MAFLVTIVVSGCAQTPSVNLDTAIYEVEFEEARAKANDFQFAILKDNKITDAEYLEAQDRYVDCMAGHGFTITADGIGNGYTYLYNLEDSNAINVGIECDRSTIGPIESLFFLVRDNPNKENMPDVYARCLVKAGVAPAGFTGSDLDALQPPGVIIEIPTATNGSDEPDTLERFPDLDLEVAEEVIIPGGKSLNSPEAEECFVNPQGH